MIDRIRAFLNSKRVKNLRMEQFYLRRALAQGELSAYLTNRHLVAPRLLQECPLLERPANTPNLSVHVLTGRKQLGMLAWSVGSFQAVSETRGALYIHSDGSLNAEDTKLLKQMFPSATVIHPGEIRTELDKALAPYPNLQSLRRDESLFMLKKLLDPWFVSPVDFRLVIDTDLIWFHDPSEFGQVCQAGSPVSLMTQDDVKELLNVPYFKDGTPLQMPQASYNSGVVLYHRDTLNMSKLDEYAGRIDISHPRSRHFVEQGGYATAFENLTLLPMDRYSIQAELTSKTVMRHYTTPRRYRFYSQGLPFLKPLLLSGGKPKAPQAAIAGAV